MKRITVLAFLTAALISMGSAYAHAQAPAFKVPFDFTVDNQVLPAGTYQVSYNAAKTAILIRSQDDRIHALTTIHPADPSISDSEVVFTKYGNQYFLHEVALRRRVHACSASRFQAREAGSPPGSTASP
jgi:hypothetical protein